MGSENNSAFSLCNLTVPSAAERFAQLDTTSLVLYSFSIAITIGLTILYAVEIYFVFKYVSKKSQRSGKVIWMAGAQPVTAIAAVIGLCVPRSLNIIHMFTLLYFARCLFMVVELVVDYFGGRVKMAYTLRTTRMRLNTMPICCCLVCLPKVEASVKNIRTMEWLVYQGSIVRPLTFLVTGIVLADAQGAQNPKIVFILMDALNIASTITVIWGVILFARLTLAPLKAYHTSVLLRLTQIIVVIYNVQDGIFDTLVRNRVITCNRYLPAATRAAIWNCHLLIFECALLALAAAYFLRPNINATFDLHPAHKHNPNVIADGYIANESVSANAKTPAPVRV